MCCNQGNQCGPSDYPFRIDAGATFAATIFWRLQETPASTPVAVDLTGYTASMLIGLGGCSTTLLATLTTENGGITLGTTNGRIDLLLTATATAQYAAGPYLYYLDLTDADGLVTRLLSGTATVYPAAPSATA